MRTPEVTVIDYGVGNLLSVQRGLEHCGAKVILTSNPEVILASHKIVLPGVGAFPSAMDALKKFELVQVIQEFAQASKPLLAICLGMQLLMDESEEFETTPGLGLIPGRVVAVPNQKVSGEKQKIPHIGWNSLHPASSPDRWVDTLLQRNMPGDAVYFVHSFMAEPTNQIDRVADAIYGGHRISAVISKDNVTGCQFHPEKSGEVGLKILRRFVAQ
jgi:glutamine amidotransferase